MSQISPPRMATVEELRPLLDLLTSMKQWALDSITYVKRRNHLSAKQKQCVEDMLEQPAYKWHGMIEGYRCGEMEMQVGAIESEIQRYKGHQAKLNYYARYYEYPAYRLDDLPFYKGPEFLLFEVTTNRYNTILYKGDHLATRLVYSLADLKPRDLLYVDYRTDYKHPRTGEIGWFKAIWGNSLVLEYGSPRLSKNRPNRSISLFNVVHIHKVQTISRDL